MSEDSIPTSSMEIAPPAATTATASHPAGWGDGLFLAFLLLAFYALLFLPQSRKAKAHRNMLAQLKVGDEVSTQAGILGKVVKIENDYICLSPGHAKTRQEWVIQKQAIAQILPKGTLRTVLQQPTENGATA